MYNADTFVLNPANADFVQGKAPFNPPRVRLLSCSTLFLIPFLLAGVFVAVAAIREWYVFAQLHRTGINTQAEVISSAIENDDGTTYYLYVQFRTSNEREYESRIQVSEPQYSQYREGDPINIRYLPEDPRIVRADWSGTEFPGLSIFLSLFALVWNFLIWVVFLGIIDQNRKLARLEQRSEKLIGAITHARFHTNDDSDVLHVQYRFQSPTGQTLMGKDQHERNDLKQKLPTVGAPLAVLYHDDKTYIAL